MAEGERAGEVIHYFNQINVAVLRLTQTLRMGDEVHFLGRHTDFKQTIDSMQIEHQAVSECGKGGEVAVKVLQRVRKGDALFRLSEKG